MKKQKYMSAEVYYVKNGKVKSKKVDNIKMKKGKTIDDLVRAEFTDKQLENRVRVVLRWNHTKTELKKD